MNDIQKGGKSHSFSIILIMVVLMLVGAIVLYTGQLTVQFNPVQENLSLSVGFGGPGSARVVETEVTSLIEGALNTVDGVSSINATTYEGGGNVTLTFKKGTNMETTRFDVATRLRQIRNKLPEGARVSLGGSVAGGGRSSETLLRYTINADMPAIEIVRYVEKHMVPKLSKIEGVESVQTSGAKAFEWVLTFDPNSLRAVGMTPNNLSSAMSRYYQNSIVGTQVLEDRLMLVKLKTRDLTGELEKIPIGMVNGRMYYMGDFATVQYREQIPNSYNRINGLNTISLYVTGMEDINTIAVTTAVKNKVEELKASLPDNFAIKTNYDASEYLDNEMQKVLLRAIISLLILLTFVLAVSRSFRYLMVIGFTIIVNMLSAVIFYKLFDVGIERYSMAGITVSLGIIIDTAIVIADHYTYYGNRKVMFSITGALLTTIGALMLVFFLPEETRANLTDFIWVIVINLTLSIVIAFLFVPALLEYLPLKNKGVVKNTMKRRRHLVRYTERYERMTVWSRNHRWIYIVGLIVLFGIPIQLLPNQVRHKNVEQGKDNTKGGLVGLYNKTIGSKWYQRNKAWFEYPLGGTLNIFQKHSGGRMSFNRDDEEVREVVLNVQANLAEGQTVQQLNEIVKEMENWLQQYDEISDFYTNLSGTSGTLEIHFKEEYQQTRFPYELKQRLWAKAMRFGGAVWTIPSLGEDDQPLTNSIYRTSWSNTIELSGYNYDILYRYAEELIDTLKANRRVNGQAGFTGRGWGSYVNSEFYMNLDRERLIRTGANLGQYLSYINEQLYDSEVSKGVYDGHVYTPVRLVSSDKDYYDLWHIRNDMVVIDSMNLRLSDLGSITKERTGLTIERNNQQYTIRVGYEFIGSYDLRAKMERELVKRFNERMPMGFRVGNGSYYGWWSPEKQRTVLIFVVVLVIFMICATMFESLKVPLMIVLLIPISFMGLFVSYPIFGVQFGQGGFAAMIMLCGITVNAGIYLTSEYRTIVGAKGVHGLKTYLKAYNRKIVPTMLTVLSTVLGLVPFLIEGKQDMFWFSFAVGVMSGMLFSVIAIVFIMPVFFPLKAKSHEIG
ncbi:MAG: efflux RND transporter permease subunit [Bacteroidaceae bacterium]|nr:efflux RND transporter permease subunit [Bacteroidaceae bacterium]